MVSGYNRSKGLKHMDPYDDNILWEFSCDMADLGVRENDAELIRLVAQQWALVFPDTTDSTSSISTAQEHSTAPPGMKIHRVDRED